MTPILYSAKRPTAVSILFALKYFLFLVRDRDRRALTLGRREPKQYIMQRDYKRYLEIETRRRLAQV